MMQTEMMVVGGFFTEGAGSDPSVWELSFGVVENGNFTVKSKSARLELIDNALVEQFKTKIAFYPNNTYDKTMQFVVPPTFFAPLAKAPEDSMQQNDDFSHWASIITSLNTFINCSSYPHKKRTTMLWHKEMWAYERPLKFLDALSQELEVEAKQYSEFQLAPLATTFQKAATSNPGKTRAALYGKRSDRSNRGPERQPLLRDRDANPQSKCAWLCGCFGGS